MALVVVLLTASGEDADIAAAYRLGANGFLVKPSEASKLEDMVRAINGFWLMQNTPPSDSLLDRRLETLANPCTQGLAGHRFPTGTSSLAQIPSGIFPADI